MADKDFGIRLQEIRKKKNFTQQQLADLLGLKNKTTLSSWEVGKSEPDITLIKNICKVLDINVNELFNLPKKYPTAQVIGNDGERIIYYDENLDDKIGEFFGETPSSYNISDNKGNKIEINKKEYDFIIGVLNNYRDSIKQDK